MAEFEAVLVSRAQASAAASTLTEVGPIRFSRLAYTDELSGDGRADLSAAPETLSGDVRSRLVDLAGFPSELRVYRDGALDWGGPIIGRQLQAGTLTLQARGLGYYLRGMWVTSDLTYSATDQFTIAAGLVDHWQALSWGDFGIDTSGVGTSGVTRDREYLAAELVNIREALGRLADADNGFDWHVEADTRDLVLSHPSRGSDLTGTVILDRRNVGRPDVFASVAAGDLASEAFGLGTGSSDAPITSTRSNTTLRETFGRWGVARTFDGVSVQATLDDHTQQLVDDRDAQLLQLGADELIPIVDVDAGAFDVGDTVAVELDAGLGVETADRRVVSKQVRVDGDGNVRLAVGFA